MNISEQVAKHGSGPLTESGLKEHIWPLFSRVLAGDKSRNEIYLANHSLGRPLDQMADDVNEGMEFWYSRLDGAWGEDAWWGAMNHFRAQVARLIGVTDPTAVVPKTAAGQGLRAVLNALPADGSNRPVRVLATRAEFDSIDFILKTYEVKNRAQVAWVPITDDLVHSENILNSINKGIDLVVLSMVIFATGEVIADLPKIIKKAHDCGAMVLLDTYHSAGVLPINMEQLDADFIIGGCYKYLRGGPGACWLAIHPKHIGGNLRTLDTGWFAKKDTFGYGRTEEPILSESGDSWLESTPPILTYYQAKAGLDLTLELGIERLRAYNLHQQEILQKAFKNHGVECFFPNDPASRGAFSLIPQNDPHGFSEKLRLAGVSTDARGKFVRFGPDLLNSELELFSAARITAEVHASC